MKTTKPRIYGFLNEEGEEKEGVRSAVEEALKKLGFTIR